MFNNLFRTYAATGIVVAALLTPFAAQADSMPSPGMSPGHSQMHHGGGRHNYMRQHRKMMMRELKSLKLSDAQWTKIHDLDKSFHTSHANAKPTKQDMKVHEDAMMTILTPAQRDQFKKDMLAHRHMQHDGMHHDGMQHDDKSAY